MSNFFTGTIMDQAFDQVQASGPFELCLQLLPEKTKDEISSEYRMWIEVKASDGQLYYIDVGLRLGKDDLFLFLCKNEILSNPFNIQTIILGRNDRSPFTTPEKYTTFTDIERHQPQSPRPWLQDLQQSFSDEKTEGTATTGDITLVPSTESFCMTPASMPYTNMYDPFTWTELTANSEERNEREFIPLYFSKDSELCGGSKKHTVVLVHKRSLENKLVAYVKEGKKTFDFTLTDVFCRRHDGTHKNTSFKITAKIWVGSVMSQSRRLRPYFQNTDLKNYLHEAQQQVEVEVEAEL
mmetsp:Transcript_45010/g.50446  ORF Transcript_45010/g.50446 Transcript_45010/m.50446 type:complete len:296 (-) Transcript_45010:164-1051(-)